MKARAPWIIYSLLVLFVACCGAWPAFTQTHWYKVRVQDDTYFYRVKVGLSHKGTPIDFDVVVGCGVRVAEHRGDSPSVDVMAWYPFVYAKAIPGGHAVAIRATVDGYRNDRGNGPCRGSTSTSGAGRDDSEPAVSPQWLPLIVWYDRADDLSHGLGYVTQDAYESPASQLEFHGATIEQATRADFERFMATAPPNLVPTYNAGNLTSLSAPYYRSPDEVPPEVVANPRLAWPRMLMPHCRGVEYIRLNEAQRAQARGLWPADHPRYWQPTRDQELKLLDEWFNGSDFGQDLFHYDEPDTPERKARRPPVYPLVTDTSLARLNKDTGRNGVYVTELLIDDALKGMLSCDVGAYNELEEAVTGRPGQFGRHNLTRICRLPAGSIAVPWSSCDVDNGAWVLFENDQYAITSHHVNGEFF